MSVSYFFVTFADGNLMNNRDIRCMFKFKHFLVRQDLCAMKVGTDGVLLGAWANGGDCILDVGTGTGLIALMMAQRYPNAQITAIDIDEGATRQALQNVENAG